MTSFLEHDWQTIVKYSLQYSLQIVFAVIILIIGWLIAKMVRAMVQRYLGRNKGDHTVHIFIGKLFYLLIILFAVIAALSKLGVQTASLIAVLGALSLAIGLSLKDSVSNLASGILLVLFRPYKLGDYVEVAGSMGTIKEIEIMFTHIDTPQNQRVVVPNSKVLGGNITNYSKHSLRRADVIFGIGYDDDITQAKQLIKDWIDRDERVLENPQPPLIVVKELADSSVNILVRVWVKRKEYWPIQYELLEAMKLKFDEVGISIPYPQMDVHGTMEPKEPQLS